MTWGEPSRVSQTFTRPFAAILANSVEALAEDGTPDPVTGVSTTAQLVGATSIRLTFNPQVLQYQLGILQTQVEHMTLPVAMAGCDKTA